MKTSHLMFGAAALGLGLYFVTRKSSETTKGMEPAARDPFAPPAGFQGFAAVPPKMTGAPLGAMYAYTDKDLRVTPPAAAAVLKGFAKRRIITTPDHPDGRLVAPSGGSGLFGMPTSANPIYIDIYGSNPDQPTALSAYKKAVEDGFVVLLRRWDLDSYKAADPRIADGEIEFMFLVDPIDLDGFLRSPVSLSIAKGPAVIDVARNYFAILHAPAGV